LNSLAFLSRAEKHFLEYNTVYLFLDNDDAGNKATEHAIKLNPSKVVDCSSNYSKSNDLNEYIQIVNQSHFHNLSKHDIARPASKQQKKERGKGLQM
jgi:DNA primase